MYRVVKANDGAEIALTDMLRFITVAKNGCFVQCDEKDARGVAVNGTAYTLFGKPQMDGTQTVLVNQIDGGAFADQTRQSVECVNSIVGATENRSESLADYKSADRDYEVGEYLSIEGRLYKVALPIIAGSRLTIGTNVEETNIVAEMANLNKGEN